MKKILCGAAVILTVIYFYVSFKEEEHTLEALSDEIVSAIGDSPAAEVFGMDSDEAFLV